MFTSNMIAAKEGIKKMKVAKMDISKYYYIVPVPHIYNGKPCYCISHPKDLFEHVRRIEFDRGWMGDVGDALKLEIMVEEIGGYRHSFCENGYVYVVGWEDPSTIDEV